MEELSTRYDPSEIENKWYDFWNEKGYFKPRGSGAPFTVVIPPPNITGTIHMGHALNLTLQDIIIRYKRMKGFKTLWVPGEDHAGIATQNAVEKALAQEGLHRDDLGREKFLEIVWDWANKYRARIVEQIKGIGASVDWSRERFTLDDGLNRAVKKAFVDLYNKGLIYKGKYIVNWCPRCHTVLSDEEVEHEEDEGAFYHIKYPFKDGSGHVIIATTRPETMLADTAVAVHPSDERYKSLVGKRVILPLVGRELTVIADRYVDPSLGTGCLKVTPAHDPNDFQIGIRHNLEMIEVIGKDDKINENGGKYAGMDKIEARKAVVRDLEEQGYLMKIEPIKHAVGKCYRCNTTIEPLLSDQWFVKTKPLAERAIEAVEKGEIVFYPERWKKVYLNWMYEIRDWCISRQLWWGHRIPVWYCDYCGATMASEEDLNACPHCGSSNIRQDEDVLDTWFSSQLWPFTTLGWPEATEDLKTFYPTSTLFTAFDIIFFWVARMIMAGYQFMNDKPFSHVYIHQLVRDKKGRKMSKSLGNGIDPLEVIKEYGTDPMRFTLAMLAAQGRDIKLDSRFFDSYRKFANKIWNATRFVLMNLDGHKSVEISSLDLELEDRWILSRLQHTIKAVTDALEAYDFNIAAKKIYSFFWNELCDWYIESVKERLKGNHEERKVAQNVLVKVLDDSLRLLHPFMPFITEELWQKLPVDGDAIIISKWPEPNKDLIDIEAESTYKKIIDIVKGIRSLKAEMNIPPSTKVKIYSVGAPFAEKVSDMISLLSNSHRLNHEKSKIAGSATAYTSEDFTLYVELGEIDLSTELKRLEKKIKILDTEISRLEKKLSNEKFIEQAPEEVVEETKEKHSEMKAQLERLKRLIVDLKV
ncbi:valyl-tRNA synthetase [Kosmotoga arenicorallina S304]|uniref:Valine--tRNA ligase n=1 Tax=Kosmotoga arenicorallina S304 TaxID=1453497 RepID=A0A176K0F8_9BACT|nr:valine--tRNA ligase [Kosmotoga arenicorallina]OAA29763.1 valyl-tRNA synthetase [Kosmotoga arenicorallina S304]